MTQQEAYQQLNEIVAKLQALHKEGQALANEHDLIFKMTSTRGLDIRTLNPDLLVPGPYGKVLKEDFDCYDAGTPVYDLFQSSSEMC